MMKHAAGHVVGWSVGRCDEAAGCGRSTPKRFEARYHYRLISQPLKLIEALHAEPYSAHAIATFACRSAFSSAKGVGKAGESTGRGGEILVLSRAVTRWSSHFNKASKLSSLLSTVRGVWRVAPRPQVQTAVTSIAAKNRFNTDGHVTCFSGDDDDSDDERDDDGPTAISSKQQRGKGSKRRGRKRDEGKLVGTSDEPDQPSSVIYIGHLPLGFEEQEIAVFLNQFGAVRECRVCRSKTTGRSKGYGFVSFRDVEVAQIVAETLSGYFLLEKRLVCHVLPNEKVHDTLFAKRKIQTKASLQNAARAEVNKKRSSDAMRFITEKLIKRNAKKQRKLASMGIDYDIPSLDEEKRTAEMGTGQNDEMPPEPSKKKKKSKRKSKEADVEAPEESAKSKKRSKEGSVKSKKKSKARGVL